METNENGSFDFRKISLFTLTMYYKNRKGKGTPEHSYRQETKFIQYGKAKLQINHRYAFERLKELTVTKRGLFISAVIYDNIFGMQLYKAVGMEAAEQTSILNFKSISDGSVVLHEIIGRNRDGTHSRGEFYPRPEIIEHIKKNYEWKTMYLKQQEVAKKFKLKIV